MTLSILSAVASAAVGRHAWVRASRQQAAVIPTTVISGSDRRWTALVGLKVIVRDVDQPDSAIADVEVIAQRANERNATWLSAKSDRSGIATLVAPDSGDYAVHIHRIGFSQLHTRLRLEVKCQQILEAYIARGEGIREPPIYTRGREPREFRPISQTGGRAVLTTCPTPEQPGTSVTP